MVNAAALGLCGSVIIGHIGLYALQESQLLKQPFLFAVCWLLGFAFSIMQPTQKSSSSSSSSSSFGVNKIQLPEPAPAPAPAAPPPAPLTPETSGERLSPRTPQTPRPVTSAAINLLRARLAPTPVGGDEGARFLAHRRGDVAKAAKQFAAFVEWRNADEIDGILDEPQLEPREREEALLHGFNPEVLKGRDLRGRCVLPPSRPPAHTPSASMGVCSTHTCTHAIARTALTHCAAPPTGRCFFWTLGASTSMLSPKSM